MIEPMITIRDNKDGEKIRASLILEKDNDNLSDLDFETGGSNPQHRSGWIGSEHFPATELWSDENGFMLIESPSGNVYGIQSIDIEWVKAEETQKLTVEQTIDKLETFCIETFGDNYRFDFKTESFSLDGVNLLVNLDIHPAAIEQEEEEEGEDN